MRSALVFLLVLSGCANTHDPPDTTSINYFYGLGKFYGSFKSIEVEIRAPLSVSKYKYFFDRIHNTMETKTNGKTELLIYYDENNRVDSVIDYFRSPQRTIFYHKTKYNDFYAKYSKENGVIVDSISRKFDSSNNTVQFIYKGEISSIDSFDTHNNLIKKILLEAKAFETYSYDSLGNVKNEYISTKINNKDSLFNIITYDYEYDKYKNWTKRTLRKNYPNGDNIVIITKRRINY